MLSSYYYSHIDLIDCYRFTFQCMKQCMFQLIAFHLLFIIFILKKICHILRIQNCLFISFLFKICNEDNIKIAQQNNQKRLLDNNEEIIKLQISNKSLKKQLSVLKKELEEINKSNQTQKKKQKLIYTDIQIMIAMNEGNKARSLLLCIQPQWIKKDGNLKDFSFLKFLQTNLSDKVVNQLFFKFNKTLIDESQLISLLTLTVIIYKIKLYQLKIGDSSKKPKIESNKIKKMVQHIAVYIIRTYGKRKNKKEEIYFIDQDGNQHKGKYYGYSFNSNKNHFSANIANYIKEYIDNEGMIKIE